WNRAAIEQLAENLLNITEPAGVGLVINDHPDIALTVNVSACHLGQEDFLRYQRRAEIFSRSDRPKFGMSTHSPDQAQQAINAGADYIGVGPVFATPTKPQAKAVGLEYVRWAAANVSIPWFAIGGITLDNIDLIINAGARRICVVSAILLSADVV